MVITLWGYWLISFREVHEKLFYRNLIVMKNFCRWDSAKIKRYFIRLFYISDFILIKVSLMIIMNIYQSVVVIATLNNNISSKRR